MFHFYSKNHDSTFLQNISNHYHFKGRICKGSTGIKCQDTWANAAGCSSSPWTSENVERVWKLVFANRLLGEKNYG